MITIFVPVLIVGVMIVLIVAWRLRAEGLTADPPGMRTYATFARGPAPEDTEHAEDAVGAAEDGAAEDETPSAPAARGADEIAHLGHGLAARGVETALPYAEDYGHALEVTLDGERFRLRLGYVGDEPDEYLLMIEPLLGVTAWRDGRYQGQALAALLGRVDQSLRELDGLRDLRWHRREDWAQGRYDEWRDAPVDQAEGGVEPR